MDIEFNQDFEKAFNFITYTNKNLFLTGKAGTGKTTFLKYLKENFRGDVVVTAPTGIAAVNAGGVTLHSFFQLPFGPLPPNDQRLEIDFNNLAESPLIHYFKYRQQKKKIISKMRLLIIDEISMVRADILDALDSILKVYGGHPELPFGGKQVLMIGDNYQLPPVSDSNQWAVLNPFYETPFFFAANVFKENPPTVLELQKIYRQHDDFFINLLNRVRENNITNQDLSTLNSQYQTNFMPSDNESYITISTHNNIVDSINKSELAKLDTDLKGFEGDIDGQFDEKSLPTKKLLNLKVGSQIMFIRNDKENPKKYYNGTLGKIIELEKNIKVKLDSNEIIQVDREEWENIEYKYNATLNKVEENVKGIFKQYPLKLAWAITVHKSQGLTFDKVILDISNCFSPGQAYVALSRCTTLEGIVLKSKIYRSTIKTAPEVISFSKNDNINSSDTIFG